MIPLRDPSRPRRWLLVGLTTCLAAAGACSPARGTANPEAAPRGAQLRLTTAPDAVPEGTPVYVAGSFNGWNPGDPNFRMRRSGAGHFAIVLPETVRGPIEFKFTLGSWDTAEASESGHDAPNRVFMVPEAGPAAYSGTVPAWRVPGSARRSTATASVGVLSEAMSIPELGRTRRVWIYLPPDYGTSTRRYPVLYMHDGQNVFDAATSYAGEWGVDETLDSLHVQEDRGAIVVAVDNAQERRFDEYSPWKHPEHGGGDGDGYVDFLANTLKPHIDRHYRTLPDRQHTGVAGSSMGGVISLYAALKHPEVFGSAGVFSPALWVTPPLFDVARTFDPSRPKPRLYFVSGVLEGTRPGAYVEAQQFMVAALASAGFRPGHEIVALDHADGTHTEGFWRREFPAAFRWMFAGPPEIETAAPR
jgi:predicted alpha/beta superfamily hydrolase